MSDSFYLSITSEAARPATNDGSASSGGNFVMDLHEELHLPGRWEVALVEASYYNQAFPNIPSDQSIIQITNKLEIFEYNYVLSYEDSKTASISFLLDGTVVTTIGLEVKAYNLLMLKYAMCNLVFPWRGLLTVMTVEILDDNITMNI